MLRAMSGVGDRVTLGRHTGIMSFHVVSGHMFFFLASSTHLSNYSLIPKLHGRMMLSRLLRVWKMAIEIVSFPMKHSGFP